MRPELKYHSVFFSLCQAVFYIFVFRHKSLTDMPGGEPLTLQLSACLSIVTVDRLFVGISFIRQLNLERIVSSRLNPLKVCVLSLSLHCCSIDLCPLFQVCLSSVVDVFADLTSRYELLFCHTILEQNKRLVLTSGTSGVGGASVSGSPSTNPLDSFFPFDPYTLKR